tara:strand:- start:848 stop:1360 length:513 start_codon:yes stop_codon:yes gene_type:complete
MSEILDVVRGISQVLAAKYDGAVDPKTGEKVEIGLRRDRDLHSVERPLMDGFSVKFYGDKICIKYQSEVTAKEVYNTDFQGEVELRYSNIQKYLQKQYKAHTGRALRLKALDEADILMQSMNKHRNWVQCTKHYKVGNIKGEPNPYTGKEDLVRDATKKFLALGKNDTPY